MSKTIHSRSCVLRGFVCDEGCRQVEDASGPIEYDGTTHEISGNHVAIFPDGRIELGMVAKDQEPEHPAPWRWEPGPRGPDGLPRWVLTSARNGMIIYADVSDPKLGPMGWSPDGAVVNDAPVRALTEAAPELRDIVESLLSDVEDEFPNINSVTRARALLTRIRERSRG